MIPLQVMPQVQALPMWIEYVKALGTPVVALVAASIAGVIAYRQWRTARNKLKLDLFDKRVEVYAAAVELIKEIVYPERAKWERINGFSWKFGAAHWLLSPGLADHLAALVQRGYEATAKAKLNTEGLTEEQKREVVLMAIYEAKQALDQETLVLNALFAPYLSLEH